MQAFETAIVAIEAAIAAGRGEKTLSGLEETLASAENETLRCVLEQHGWSGHGDEGHHGKYNHYRIDRVE